MPITLDARRNYVEGVVPLSFWLARKLAGEGLPLAQALTAKTPLYRLTSLYDGHRHPARPEPGWKDERWAALLEEWRCLFAQHAGDPDGSALERAGLERLRPLLEARLEQDVNEWHRSADRPFGFFNCHVAEDAAGRREIHLHLFNAFAPQSPFADPPARARELARLLEDAQWRWPGLWRVQCGSWLNSFPPFLEFFPAEWAAGATPRPLVYSNGWWGQFVDRSGGFHLRNGAHLRATGTFPFPSVSCACAPDALREHLRLRWGVEETAQGASRPAGRAVGA